MTRDRNGDRILVARHTRDQGRARDAVQLQLLHPAVGEVLRRARGLPAEQSRYDVRVLGGRQAVTILTKLTWWCGGIFLALSLLLSVVPRGGGSTELQERLRAATPGAPAPSAPLPLGGTPDTAAGPAPSAGAPAPQQQPGK